MRGSWLRTTRCLSRSSYGVNRRQAWFTSARWSSTAGEHKWSTPLAKQLTQAITITGPIPVASYMRQCLTSDLGGYYTPTTRSGHDQFGAKGDFITSPEISQIFGELIGVWIVAEWIAQGRKSEGVQLMELGPGRGTLMDDVLRTIGNFPSLAKAIEAVYLVEASANLREAQHKLLCGDNTLHKNDIGFESIGRHSSELKIVWCEDVRFVPREASKTPFIVAHEFFDALPIHVFQSVAPPPDEQQAQSDSPINTLTGSSTARPRKLSKQNQWREVLVSPTPPHRLKEDQPEFELTLSKAATPHSMYLPETSPRYQALKSSDGASIEISPESQAYARDIAIRLGGSNPPAPGKPTQTLTSTQSVSPMRTEEPLLKADPSGAALIIDYGLPASIPTNSLRGIRSHQRISPFMAAGTTDVSVDVDFLALAESAINGSPHVEVHGPVDQGRFLTAMGIKERASQLVKRAVDKERGGSTGQDKAELTEIVKRIESGWRRLVDQSPQGMGRLYQVMAILPYKPQEEVKPKRRPVGFGGDIAV